MKILVFQHLSVEHPGIFREFWRADGHEWTVVELDVGEAIPDLDPFDFLAVMGGPMDVWQADLHPWLTPEITAIRHWVEGLGRPYLGICLGHQLLAEALGGTVGPMAGPEVGLSPVDLTEAGRADPVLSRLGARFNALHWHGAEVSRLPEGAVRLAESSLCPVQAMRWGRHAYGIQCHIEITAETSHEWERIPEYRSSLQQTLGSDGAVRLAQEIAAEIEVLNASARAINEAMMSLVAPA